MGKQVKKEISKMHQQRPDGSQNEPDIKTTQRQRLDFKSNAPTPLISRSLSSLLDGPDGTNALRSSLLRKVWTSIETHGHLRTHRNLSRRAAAFQGQRTPVAEDRIRSPDIGPAVVLSPQSSESVNYKPNAWALNDVVEVRNETSKKNDTGNHTEQEPADHARNVLRSQHSSESQKQSETGVIPAGAEDHDRAVNRRRSSQASTTSRDSQVKRNSIPRHSLKNNSLLRERDNQTDNTRRPSWNHHRRGSALRLEDERSLDRLAVTVLGDRDSYNEFRVSTRQRHLRRRARTNSSLAAGQDLTRSQDESNLWFIGTESKPLARFRQAVRTVQFLLKATISSRQEGQRSQAKLLSFAQYQDDLEASNSAIYSTGLVFNPNDFKAIREVKLSAETKAVLSMEPEDRTDEQLRMVLINVQQSVNAFSEYPTKVKYSLVKVGWYEKYETKRVIIRQGHRAENFYFIISGTAVVTLLVVDQNTGEPYVRTAAFLGKGNSFGEIGLMHGSQRSATVTCKEDLELLAVRREDFIDIFMHIDNDNEPPHVTFLRGLDILDGWPVKEIPWDDPKICLFTYFRRGTVMCRDSSQSEWIYFLKTGSCRVLAALRSTKPQSYGGGGQSRRQSRDSSKQTTPRHEGSKLERLTQALHAPPPPPKMKGTKERGKSLPPLFRKKKKYEEEEDYEDHDEGNEHKKMILDLYKLKHPHTNVAMLTAGDLMTPTVERVLQPVEEDTPPTKPEMVFVQLQKLGPKDSFGVSEAAFSGVIQNNMAMSLVSDGAEAVLISRKFFLQHLSDDKRRQLRETVQPYPTEDSLQQKLQDKTNWEAYKNTTVKEWMAYRQFCNDSLNW